MSDVIFPRFLSECIVQNHEQQAGLRGDDMWGLFLCWCALNQEEPGEEKDFWVALKALGYSRGGDRVWRGFTMTGPAAVDYILSTHPSLV